MQHAAPTLTAITRIAGITRAALAASWLIAAAAPGARAQTPPSLAAAGLTPLGAERAGNADGSIPPWTGDRPPASDASATAARPAEGSESASVSPLFVITAANLAQYRSLLPDGAIALFGRYPDYRMSVHRSRRDAPVRAEIAAAAAANLTAARPAPGGLAAGVAGAHGAIPFPHPQNGAQAIWNHLLADWGVAREIEVATYVANEDGSVEQTAGYREITDFPYYYPAPPGAAASDPAPEYYLKTLRTQTYPAARAGEAYLAWQSLDTGRAPFAAWRYLRGEHRARKAAPICYDTPDADAAGLQALDEYYLFSGAIDRYDFTLLGKREMIVPYHEESAMARPARELMGPHHAMQDLIRYERHRVWVVEARLAAGQHHVAPRRRFYLDEDSWHILYSEAWDETGKLWKFGHAMPILLAGHRGLILGSQFVYDLTLGGYAYDFVFQDGPQGYHQTPPHPAATFDPTTLAARALR